MGRLPLWTRRAATVCGFLLAGLGALAGGYFGVQQLLPGAPSRAPTVPQAVAGTPSPSAPGRLVIHGTGDVLLDPSQLGILASGYGAPWTEVADLFRSDDLTVVNLECAPGLGAQAQDKEFTFRCPSGFEAMAAAGVEVASLGNNHSLDFGRTALLDGLDRLERAGVAAVGAGRDAALAHTPAVFERNGWTIAVLGFSGVVPEPGWFAGANHPGVANGYSIGSMTEAVRSAKEVADLVFVTIHWGIELQPTPRSQDVARARALVDAGADGIFGHHAHVVQPLDFYRGKPIAYGLGNFVWPRSGPTAVARFVVEPDGTIGACLLPGRIGGGRPTLEATECPT